MEATCISKAQRSSLDIITTLPQAIIENILCLLPIEEAARTSILSWEWRYKWTKIPKLVFSHSTVKEDEYWSSQKEISDVELERKNKDMNRKLFSAIHLILLQRRGPIHEFTLSMDTSIPAWCELDQTIIHFSRNHPLKKLKLAFDDPGYDKEYSLPTRVFWWNHLTDLYLEYCEVKLPAVFLGFDNLTSLTLKKIRISEEDLLDLISSCHSLKSLCLMLEDHSDDCPNPNMMELLKCLPEIERFTTWGYYYWLDIDDCVPDELPTPLVHLKYICVEELGFSIDYSFNFIFILIKCSPNLEKLEIKIDFFDFEIEDTELSVILEKYSDVWLEHLTELEIVNFSNYEFEVLFLTFMLSKSPNLKKLVLYRSWMFDRDEEFELLEDLFHAQRPANASPIEVVLMTRFSRDEELEMLKTLLRAPGPQSASPAEVVIKDQKLIKVFRGFDNEN